METNGYWVAEVVIFLAPILGGGRGPDLGTGFRLGVEKNPIAHHPGDGAFFEEIWEELGFVFGEFEVLFLGQLFSGPGSKILELRQRLQGSEPARLRVNYRGWESCIGSEKSSQAQ